MRELAPAWPPMATASSDTVSSPSDAPYTAAASPAGPAADDDEVEQCNPGGDVEREAEVLGELARRRAAQHRGRA